MITKQDFLNASSILIWGFAITGMIAVLAVPQQYAYLVFLSNIIAIVGMALIRKKVKNADIHTKEL